MATPVRDQEALSARLEALFDRFVSRRSAVHHAVVALARGDGTFRWSRGYGTAQPDGPPMDADTPYFVLSVSKLYLATVVLLLVERGQVRLDDPIGAYLPAEVIGGLHTWRGRDRVPEITVRHLLSHTSGLPDYIDGKPTRGGRSVRERLIEEGDGQVDPFDSLRIVREELNPHFPPQPPDARRQRAVYADTNFLLLGLILQSVTGRSLGQLYEEVLFRPLGLDRTYLYGRTRPRTGTPGQEATIWYGERPLPLKRAMSTFLEDGIVSTANDALKFLTALVQGRVFTDPGTLQMMQGRWNRVFFPFEYALGTMRFRLPRFLSLRRVPALVGHAGSTGSWLYHCAELDLLLSGTLDQEAAPSLPYRLLPRVLLLCQGAMR